MIAKLVSSFAKEVGTNESNGRITGSVLLGVYSY
jgi:hypothetical protein